MIVVSGSTGNVGHELVPLLVQRDLDVRCLVHAGGRSLQADDAEVVEVDLDRPETFGAALQGCERLFLLTPPHPAQVERETALVDAAVRAGTSHVVAVSVMGADPRSPSSFARWHAAIDAHLLDSGMDATLLRPAAFMQVHLLPATAAAEGRWYGTTGDGAHGFVDAQDVADAAAHVLGDSRPPTGVHELTGPRAITVPEAARAYGQALGHDVEYVDLPPEQLSAAMTANGVPPFLAEAIGALYTGIRAGHAATTTHGVEELTGRPPHSYEDVLDRLGSG